ncbi:Zn-dependent protease [Halalkaliarchaeum sp. AArc-CO]|uniref:metalloprotease n=1 Tax=unclassified Halalkaliarchaeum TaxID=2678344 RepID=UPI00217D7987|nr:MULTISPECIES: metalloprotease [unclassified Halalkaliarchaeum]MDR5672611.1 metalloprotease [Halalkaliarchaeum sp. AArc-GB]UWG50434.1 Zn-dependent protease [Halalkaliarchaeum sp. AArc-CO]
MSRHGRGRDAYGVRIGQLQFSQSELQDLLVAWLALGVAFALFFVGGAANIDRLLAGGIVIPVLVSLFTAGLGFLLHELAHKVVAVHYDQVAAFEADYGMLFLAVMSALLGFIFAAPGAVVHRGRLTLRQHGLIALAGPVTNVILTALFIPVMVLGVLFGSDLIWLLGSRGFAINIFLAAFNLIPYGPLDGKTVIQWSKLVWVVFFVPTVVIAVVSVFGYGLGFGGSF